MKKTIIPLLACLLVFHGAPAQSCKYLPADCPVGGVEDFGTPDDSTSRLGNPVLPREITMENGLRRWTAALVNRIAESHGWQVYQVSEEASSGFSTDKGVIIAYPFRPPHWYYVTWEFIVNNDSLQAWRAWLTDFAQKRLDALNQNAAAQTAAYDRAKPYRDSAEHYSLLMGQYAQDHMAQYQKDLVGGNKTGISSYEKAVAAYQKKSDYFSQKAAAIQNNDAAETSGADADALRKRQTLHFRDASLLIVEFGFNMDYAKTAGTPSSAPGATAAAPASTHDSPIFFTNPDPDAGSIDAFARSHTSVLLLQGEWPAKPDRYGGYRPVFETIKTSTDVTTPKRIRSDQVQTIDCHISGNPQAIRQFLAALPQQEMKAMIAKE